MKDEFRSGAHPLGQMPFPTELEGTVSQYLLNPRGEVDGFLLDGRMVVKFPPHLTRELIQVIKPKERVRVNGYLEADKPATGRAIREIKPTPPERAGAVGALQPLSVVGAIGVVKRNPHGEIDGVIFDDGIILHFPPHAGRQFARLLREGQLLAAVGFGTVNDFGQAIAAAMIGPSADALGLIEPPPVKPKRRPEDKRVREEE
jgi:hypothetical protein